MPMAAAILDFISGASSIGIGFYLTVLLIFFVVQEAQGLRLIWLPATTFVIIAGVLAIVGGAYAFKRKKWRFALVGAVAASLALVPLAVALSYMAHPAWSLVALPAIATVIVTLLSKKQFA